MKKKKKSHSLKLKVHKNCNYTCAYCGKIADKIINGLAYEYNPVYEVSQLIKFQEEQRGCRSVFDVDIFISFEVDHIIPEFKGGETDSSNLTLSCRSCNRKKGVMSY